MWLARNDSFPVFKENWVCIWKEKIAAAIPPFPDEISKDTLKDTWDRTAESLCLCGFQDGPEVRSPSRASFYVGGNALQLGVSAVSLFFKNQKILKDRYRGLFDAKIPA